MDEILVPIIVAPTVIGILFLGLPWLIFHYVTKWKSQAVLTDEDERLLDEMNEMARRLDDRLATIERIMTAENPNWRSLAADPASIGIEDHASVRRIGR
jgi:phage shock protein B